MAFTTVPSDIDQTNQLLRRIAARDLPPVALLLTGSSGCGKTHLCEELNRLLDQDRAEVYNFDKIGVPSPEEMVRQFGSGEKWQEVTTHEWIGKLAAQRDQALVVFEG